MGGLEEGIGVFGIMRTKAKIEKALQRGLSKTLQGFKQSWETC